MDRETKQPSAAFKRTARRRLDKSSVEGFLHVCVTRTLESRVNTPWQEQKQAPIPTAVVDQVFKECVRCSVPTHIFWKYVKQHFPDEAVFRRRKAHKYRGYSGLRFLDPDNTSDASVVATAWPDVEAFMSVTERDFLERLRQAQETASRMLVSPARRASGSSSEGGPRAKRHLRPKSRQTRPQVSSATKRTRYHGNAIPSSTAADPTLLGFSPAKGLPPLLNTAVTRAAATAAGGAPSSMIVGTQSTDGSRGDDLVEPPPTHPGVLPLPPAPSTLTLLPSDVLLRDMVHPGQPLPLANHGFVPTLAPAAGAASTSHHVLNQLPVGLDFARSPFIPLSGQGSPFDGALMSASNAPGTPASLFSEPFGLWGAAMPSITTLPEKQSLPSPPPTLPEPLSGVDSSLVRLLQHRPDIVATLLRKYMPSSSSASPSSSGLDSPSPAADKRDDPMALPRDPVQEKSSPDAPHRCTRQVSTRKGIPASAYLSAFLDTSHATTILDANGMEHASIHHGPHPSLVMAHGSVHHGTSSNSAPFAVHC